MVRGRGHEVSDDHRDFRPGAGDGPDERDPWAPPGDEGSGAVRIVGPRGASGAPPEDPPLRFSEDDTGPMPHWTDPPTGEVPRVLGGDGGDDETRSDDVDDWGAAPVWRDDRGALPGFEDVPELDERGRLGALAEPSGDASDPFFDDFEGDGDAGQQGPPSGPTAVTPISTRGGRSGGRGASSATASRSATTGADGAPGRQMGGRDLPIAIGVGLALGALFVLALRLGPRFAVALVVIVVVAAAIEFFDGLRRVGYQPATLLGLVAVAALPVAAYWRYESGVLLVLAITLVATLGWYVLADLEVKAVPNIAVTFLGIGYIGFLGAYAALMLAIPEAGTGILFGVVACTVAADVGALFVGSGVGGAPLAPSISPNKTVAGLVGGVLASVVVGLVLGTTLAPWDGELVYGLQLGIVVGLAAALGDLVESRMKRDLGLKDFGTLLPGHGGVLDRCDAFLFTLPAAYYLVRILNLY